MFWQLEIAQLQKDNDEAVRLIDQYVSRSRIDPSFQQECASFREHTTRWKARWDFASNTEQTGLPLQSDELIADPFPKTFDQALEAEMVRVRRRVEELGP